MVIQIERIWTSSARRSALVCSAPQCNAQATWFLVDRDMPEFHETNLGERPCCTVHIAATYLSLRGAHLIAQSGRVARLSGMASLTNDAESASVS
jgi:hypothetical protein